MCWTHTPSGWHSPWLWCALPTRDEAEGLCSRRCPGLLPPLRNLEEVALRNWDAALRQWDSALLRWDAFYSEWRGSRPHEDASRDESSTAHLLIWAAAPAIETQTEVETAPVAHPVVVPSAPLPLTIEASLEEEPPGSVLYLGGRAGRPLQDPAGVRPVPQLADNAVHPVPGWRPVCLPGPSDAPGRS